MIHFIYVAGKINGPVKIGITTNVLRRVRELQTGSPVRIELLYVHPAGSKDRARRIEQFAHECLTEDGHSLSGEWFNVSAADAVETMSDDIGCDARQYKKWKTLFEDAEFIE